MKKTTLPRGWVAFAIVTVSMAGFPATPTWAQQDEEPPYQIRDGKVDWYTYSGFRRYHAECHVCHGPDGLGSSFAPALLESLKVLSRGQQ